MIKLLLGVVYAIAIFLDLPLIIITKLGLLVFRSDIPYSACAQLLSLIPDYPGIFLRVAFYRFALHKFSLSGTIGFGTIVTKTGARIGKNYFMGGNNLIGLVDIGDNVVIASGVHILSGRRQHNFSNVKTEIMDGDVHLSLINIGDDVFIGDKCIVMADIGEKSIVGAGSVVVKPIPPYSVVAGNPARVVRQRTPVTK